MRNAVLRTDANSVTRVSSHGAARPCRHQLDEAERMEGGLTLMKRWERVAQKRAPFLYGGGHVRLRERVRARGHVAQLLD